MDGSYRTELARKAIHLSSLSIPIIYYYLSRQQALFILIPLTTIVLAIDLSRYYFESSRIWFSKLFGWMLRRHETDARLKNLNGASYVLISAALCVLFFPKLIVLTSFAVLIVSDSMAALIGKRFGKPRYFGKSLEGSFAFLLSGLLVVLLTPKIEHQLAEYFIGSLGVLAGTLAEALPLPTDDNLSIPLTVGLTMWLGYIIGLPTLDVYKLG